MKSEKWKIKSKKWDMMHGGGNAWMKLIGIKEKRKGRKEKKDAETVG